MTTFGIAGLQLAGKPGSNTDLVVEEIDERLSTVEAQRQLHLSGKNTKKSTDLVRY